MTVNNHESWKQIQIEQSRRALASRVAVQRQQSLQENLEAFFLQVEQRKAREAQEQA